MVKKNKIAIWLNNGTALTRVKKSTALTISMNPVKTDYDFISDENASTELEGYKPSIDQDLTMFEGEPDYEMIWNHFYEMRIGSDAHTPCVIAFMNRPVDDTGKDIPYGTATTPTSYRAWQFDSVLSIKDLAAVDKKINFEILFGGTINKGTIVMTSGVPVFTAKA
jgi:hypothetical protein